MVCFSSNTIIIKEKWFMKHAFEIIFCVLIIVITIESFLNHAILSPTPHSRQYINSLFI